MDDSNVEQAEKKQRPTLVHSVYAKGVKTRNRIPFPIPYSLFKAFPTIEFMREWMICTILFETRVMMKWWFEYGTCINKKSVE